MKTTYDLGESAWQADGYAEPRRHVRISTKVEDVVVNAWMTVENAHRLHASLGRALKRCGPDEVEVIGVRDATDQQ